MKFLKARNSVLEKFKFRLAQRTPIVRYLCLIAEDRGITSEDIKKRLHDVTSMIDKLGMVVPHERIQTAALERGLLAELLVLLMAEQLNSKDEEVWSLSDDELRTMSTPVFCSLIWQAAKLHALVSAKDVLADVFSEFDGSEPEPPADFRFNMLSPFNFYLVPEEERTIV
jgi:hypothetical protein